MIGTWVDTKDGIKVCSRTVREEQRAPTCGHIKRRSTRYANCLKQMKYHPDSQDGQRRQWQDTQKNTNGRRCSNYEWYK